MLILFGPKGMRDWKPDPLSALFLGYSFLYYVLLGIYSLFSRYLACSQ